jgi:hypothetical protein
MASKPTGQFSEQALHGALPLGKVGDTRKHFFHAWLQARRGGGERESALQVARDDRRLLERTVNCREERLGCKSMSLTWITV